MPSLVERGQVGKREDLADIIENVDQKDMPVTSMIRKGSAPKNSIVEWQVDIKRQNVSCVGRYFGDGCKSRSGARFVILVCHLSQR